MKCTLLIQLLPIKQPEALYRVDHSPVQRVGEKLRPRCGDLLNKALYVLAFLLCVDAAFGPWNFCPIQPQTLVIITVVQWNQFPFARLLISLFIIELVENTFHGRQLLSLPNVELTGTVGGTWRRENQFIFLARSNDANQTDPFVSLVWYFTHLVWD